MSRQRLGQGISRGPAVRALLAVMLLAGALLIFLGLRGLWEYETSGFSSEAAFGAIHRLGSQAAADWQYLLRPPLQSLSAEDAAALGAVEEQLLRENWAEKSSDGPKQAEALLEAVDGEDRTALLNRLLYVSYRLGGPKLSTSQHKSLLAELAEENGSISSSEESSARESAAEQDVLPLRLLRAVTDETVSLSPTAEKAADGLTGSERQAMLLQLFYTSLSDRSGIRGADVNSFKQSVRDKSAQLDAIRMIARQEISAPEQFAVSHSRSVVLAGILLAADALLLAFLMASGRDWRFDVKQLLILAIVDFLLLFQLMVKTNE